MEHPPPLPTTSLEDLPPPYLDYLDAAALCRLGYGTTKKQHFGVTSAAVRCATDRDAVPLSATAPPGARDALELLRRRERAVCWEPFGARSQFLRRRWRRGPTTPDDAPRDGDDDDEPPRPWRYRELRTTAAGLVLDGGGEMNFTGVHRPFGGVRRPTRIRFQYCAPARSASRGYCNVCFSSADAAHRALRFFRIGHPDVFSFLIPLWAGDRLQLWLPRSRYAVALAGPDEAAADAKHDVDCRLLWDVAGEIGAPALWMDVRVDGRRHHDGPLAMKLPPSYDGLRHVYLFNWVQDENTFVGTPPAQRPPSPVSNARCVISDLFVEDGPVDAEFSTNVRSEARRRAECFRHGVELEGVLQALGVGVQSAGTDPVIVVEGDPQAHTLGDFDERDADGSGDDDDGSIFSFDDDESGDGSDAESRSDFDEEDEEDEGVARPASFAEIVDDDVDVDEAPNLSV